MTLERIFKLSRVQIIKKKLPIFIEDGTKMFVCFIDRSQNTIKNFSTDFMDFDHEFIFIKIVYEYSFFKKMFGLFKLPRPAFLFLNKTSLTVRDNLFFFYHSVFPNLFLSSKNSIFCFAYFNNIIFNNNRLLLLRKYGNKKSNFFLTIIMFYCYYLLRYLKFFIFVTLKKNVLH
jgi:hypothetical protein